MVNEAVKAIVPIAAGIGAASGALAPRRLPLVPVSSPLSSKAASSGRIGTGMALGAAEEFVSETAEQMTQNYGYNVATGDTRPIMEGALEAGATGAAVGGVVGGLGGIRADTDTNLSGGSTETGTPTPEQSGTWAASTSLRLLRLLSPLARMSTPSIIRRLRRQPVSLQVLLRTSPTRPTVL